MRRRSAIFSAALSLVAIAAFGAPPQGRIARIGVLAWPSAENDPCLAALRKGLGAIGYTEGHSYEFELRYAGGNTELLPTLAEELVASKIDVIVVCSGTAVEAAAKATKTIPIVMASSFYPVEMGFIASLARPGGNLTGVTHFTPDLMKKRVQLLHEAVPTVSRAALLRLPGHLQDLVVADMSAAGHRLGIQLIPFEVQQAEDLTSVFDATKTSGVQAVISTQAPFFWKNRETIAQLALEHRLPSVSGEPDAAVAGALLFYGPNVLEGYGPAVDYVDRVLNGAKPAELPVVQPTKITLVINLKTAKALALAIPRELLARADEVIE